MKKNERRLGGDSPADVEEQQEVAEEMQQSLPDMGIDFSLPDDDDFELDLSDSSVTGLLPEGTYEAYLNDVEKSTSQKGDPLWLWYFTPITNVPVNTLRLYTVLTATAAWKVIETVVALGLGKMGEKMNFKKADAINRMCLIEVIHEEWPKNSGNMRPSISKVMPHPDGTGKKFQPFSGVPTFTPPSE